MTIDRPLVSIVIPTYNRWPLVNEAIESALGQDHPNIQVILVDDGSTDGTVERLAIEDPRLRVIRQQNSERGAARNRGAAVADGAYLSFLDADDILEPWHVSQLAAALNPATGGQPRQTAETTVFWAAAEMWDPETDRQEATNSDWWINRYSFKEATQLGTVLPLQGLFVPVDSFIATGGFPEARSVAASEDWVFLIRLAGRYRFSRLGRPSVLIRSHAGRSMADVDATIASRRKAASLVLSLETGSTESAVRARALVVAGTHRLAAARLYEAGRMREARHEMAGVVRALGFREGASLVRRLWAQSLLGRSVTGALRRRRRN